MLKRILGWEQCSSEVYRNAYKLYGGSVCSHPDVLAFLSEKLEREIVYFCKRKSGVVVAAAYSASGSLCLFSKEYPFVYEDIILPCASDSKVVMPVKTKKLSPMQNGLIINSINHGRMKNKICYMKSDFSKKTAKKRNNEKNRFLNAGGEIVSIENFSSQEICDAYLTLFKVRWNEKIKTFNEQNLFEAVERFRHLLFGFALVFNKKVIAIDLIFKSETDHLIYFDDINGGYDPHYSDLSVGSILLWENYNRAKEMANQKNKKLIFSLGIYRDEWQYKKLWCDLLTLGRTIY